LLIAVLAVINLVTSPGYLWFLRAAVYFVAHLAWNALKLYYPESDRR
jgi:hypothetical protein